MSENIKRVIGWIALLIVFVAGILVSPDPSAKIVLAMLAVLALYRYGRNIWEEWER